MKSPQHVCIGGAPPESPPSPLPSPEHTHLSLKEVPPPGPPIEEASKSLPCPVSIEAAPNASPGPVSMEETPNSPCPISTTDHRTLPHITNIPVPPPALSEVPNGLVISPSNGARQPVNSPIRNDIRSLPADQSTVEEAQPTVSAGDSSSVAQLTPSNSPTLGADDSVSVPVSPKANEGSIPLVTGAFEIQEKDPAVESTTTSRELVIYQGRKRPAETQDDIDGCERKRVQRRRLEYSDDGPGSKRGGAC